MRYTFKTQSAALAVLTLIGMGGLCADSSTKPVPTKRKAAQKECAYGTKCNCAPNRSTNFWVSGDLLIWSANIGGLSSQYGDATINTTIVNSRPTTAIIESNQDIDFTWRPGVRIGAGFDWPCSGWETGAYWTHFHAKGSAHEHANSASSWLHFNVADALIGRKFWVGSCVSLKPFTGVRYAQIKQGLRTHLETEIIAATGSSVVVSTLRDKEKLWAFGPELGLEAVFCMGHKWSVYGNLGGAILYGHTTTTFNTLDAFALADNSCVATTHDDAVQWAVDMGLGLRWNISFLTLQAGLENHTYFDYNELGCSGDLNLYGANFSATIHF